MGINTADFIDLEDMDVFHDSELVILSEMMLREEDGTLTEENQQKVDKFREDLENYATLRKELYAKSYEKVSLWLYQMDKRGLHTEEEFLGKLRELKQETKDERNRLEEELLYHNQSEPESDKTNNK